MGHGTIPQVAITTTNKVYTWGCHPHNLRQVATAMRQNKASGRYVPEQTSFLIPSLVDTTYVHGNITKVGIVVQQSLVNFLLLFNMIRMH